MFEVTAAMERQVFNRQPGGYGLLLYLPLNVPIARALLVDLQGPMDMTTCTNIYQALSDVLSVLVHLLGSGRLPLFSLLVQRSYIEVCVKHIWFKEGQLHCIKRISD